MGNFGFHAFCSAWVRYAPQLRARLCIGCVPEIDQMAEDFVHLADLLSAAWAADHNGSAARILSSDPATPQVLRDH